MKGEVAGGGEVVRLAAPGARPAAAPLQRVAPTAGEAEIEVIAAILQNNAVLERVQARGLRAEHFADERCAKLYDSCVKLQAKSRVANAVTLKQFCANAGLFDDDGFAMLGRLQTMQLPLGAASDAAAEIVAAFQKREMLALLERTAEQIYAPDVDMEVRDIIARTSIDLDRLEDSAGAVGGGVLPVTGFLAAALTSADRAFKSEGLSGVPTGLRDLDAKTGGLHPSDLIIIAGRPAMGKSALLMKIMQNAAERLREEPGEDGRMKRVDGGRGIVFSLEMTGEQLANRMLGDACSIPSDKIRRGDIDAKDFPKLTEAAGRLGQLPLHIDDTPSMTIARMRAAVRRFERRHGKVHVIGVDYLQLLASDVPVGTRGGPDNRVGEISAITRGLKALGKELDCAVVALSQLSRALEARDDKRPQLADLRESGTIEQDADVVMFCYREAYYHEKAEPRQRAEEGLGDFGNRHENWARRLEEIANRGDVILGKQRHGPTGTVALGWEGAFTRWHNLPQPAEA